METGSSDGNTVTSRREGGRSCMGASKLQGMRFGLVI
jgi:hypothetical protein